MPSFTLLHLLQLTSASLPVGAFNYSEGLEALVEQGVLHDAFSLEHWLKWELQHGAIRIEASVMLRAYFASCSQDLESLQAWNYWLSAFRETEEMRQQSWQMGRSLLKLLRDTHQLDAQYASVVQESCNFAIAYALAASCWQIDPDSALLGYLYSWIANLISASVKLIPLGQTAAQQLLLDLYPALIEAAQAIPVTAETPDAEWLSCSWGMTLASMAHETLYTRLFRS